MENSIIFLGTGGARFMVTSQILASGGLWLSLNGTEVLVDPGPGCIVHATQRKLNPENLSAIILSHRHLDHSADLNIMVEAMTQGGFNRHGRLFAPSDAFGNEPVIYSYLKAHLEGVEILQAGKAYSIDSVSFTTPVRHIHGAETYGMVFKSGQHTFSYIADTRFFEELCRSYSGQVVIINVVMMSAPADWPIDHLSIPDAEHIIAELKPEVAILTHFGMSMWRAKPQEVAQQLSQRIGVRVIAAQDGMKFDLDRMDSV